MRLCFDLLGTCVSVDLPEPHADTLSSLWSSTLRKHCFVDDSHQMHVVPAPDGWQLVGGDQLHDSSSADTPVGMVARYLNAMALSCCRHLAIHAGVVARAGCAVALPAASGVGKTTLVAACLAQGWEYVSDEALCLDSAGAGSVITYPKPLTLDVWGVDRLELPRGVPGEGDDLWFSPSDLRAEVAAGPQVLGHVVELSRRSGFPRPVLREQHRSRVLSGLLPFAFNHYKNPGRSVDVLAQCAQVAHGWTLEYTDAVAAAEVLTSTFPGRS